MSHAMLSKKLNLVGYKIDTMQSFFCRDEIAMPEFEFVKLAYSWCEKTATTFEDLLPLFDLNTLTSEQKAWVLGQVPVSPAVAALVMNALCSSNILYLTELQHFHLDYPGIRWKRLYDSSVDRLTTFHDAVDSSMNMFQRTLVVFQLDEQLSIVIYIPRKVENSRDCLIDNACRLFVFPHPQGPQRQHRLVLPTKIRYQLCCDGHVFQLFENARSNSWIYLSGPVRTTKSTDKYRTEETGDGSGRESSTRESKLNFAGALPWTSSVGSCKHILAGSTGLQLLPQYGLLQGMHLLDITADGKKETYVISNRDIASMRNLDLWLEYVDTVEKLRLFPQEAKQYSIQDRKDVVASSSPSWLVEIIAKNNLSLLRRLESLDQYRMIFTAIRRASDKGFLLQCFEYILGKIIGIAVNANELLQEVIDLSAVEPDLVMNSPPFLHLYLLIRTKLWSRCCEFRCYEYFEHLSSQQTPWGTLLSNLSTFSFQTLHEKGSL